jgi:hypothetical protein
MSTRLPLTLAHRVTLDLRLRPEEVTALGGLVSPPKARAALAAYLGLPEGEVPTMADVERAVGSERLRARVRELLLEVARPEREGRRSGTWRPDPACVERARETLCGRRGLTRR